MLLKAHYLMKFIFLIQLINFQVIIIFCLNSSAILFLLLNCRSQVGSTPPQIRNSSSDLTSEIHPLLILSINRSIKCFSAFGESMHQSQVAKELSSKLLELFHSYQHNISKFPFIFFLDNFLPHGKVPQQCLECIRSIPSF